MRATVRSASFDFSGLTSATNSVINVTGSTPTFSHLANVDGSSLFVSGGGTLALPLLTSYVNQTASNDQFRTLQSSGAGSVLDLHNVTTITNGTNFDTNLTIQALSGATMSNVTAVPKSITIAGVP